MAVSSKDVDGAGKISGDVHTRQEHVHRAMRSSLSLVPSGCSKLFGMLKSHYPHRRVGAEALSDFARQALRMTQYAPLMEINVVKLIVERSLEIDVEIKIMDTGEAVVDDEEEEGALFTMDDLVYGTPKKDKPKDEVDEMAEKLDSVMLVLFGYLDHRLSGRLDKWAADAASGDNHTSVMTDSYSGQEKEGQAEGIDGGQGVVLESVNVKGVDIGVDRLLQSLIGVFEDVILTTHRSKFVQFTLFYACGRSPWLGSLLSTKLQDVFKDDTKPKLTRQTSVAYLASFLARGSFVKDDVLSSSLSSLLDWAVDYLDRQAGVGLDGSAAQGGSLSSEGMQGGQNGLRTPGSAKSHSRSWHSGSAYAGSYKTPNGGRGTGAAGSWMGGGGDHMLFYSVCQASFYIMCFRGEDIAGCGAIVGQAASWGRLLRSPLCPLKYCLDTVRKEFARLCCQLLSDHLNTCVLDYLSNVADEVGPKQGAQVSVGLGLPQSAGMVGLSTGSSNSTTKAGGLGRGCNPLDSFFPFDPYLLRRSHVYIAGMYITWKGPKDDKVPAEGKEAKGSRSSTSDVSSDSDSDQSSTDESDNSDCEGNELGDEISEMDTQSFSMQGEARQAAGELMSRGRHGVPGSSWGDGGSGVSLHGSDLHMAVSQKLASSYISEGMSVTPASSVAMGSSVGRGMLASSLADDGRWGQVSDEAFFHQNVSPSTTPP
ncbi:unnamed protein product [Choristocarpus tenellus]